MASRVHTMGLNALQSKLSDLLWPQAANVSSSATLSLQGPETLQCILVSSSSPLLLPVLCSDTKGLTECIQYFRVNKTPYVAISRRPVVSFPAMTRHLCKCHTNTSHTNTEEFHCPCSSFKNKQQGGGGGSITDIHVKKKSSVII